SIELAARTDPAVSDVSAVGVAPVASAEPANESINPRERQSSNDAEGLVAMISLSDSGDTSGVAKKKTSLPPIKNAERPKLPDPAKKNDAAHRGQTVGLSKVNESEEQREMQIAVDEEFNKAVAEFTLSLGSRPKTFIESNPDVGTVETRKPVAQAPRQVKQEEPRARIDLNKADDLSEAVAIAESETIVREKQIPDTIPASEIATESKSRTQPLAQKNKRAEPARSDKARDVGGNDAKQSDETEKSMVENTKVASSVWWFVIAGIAGAFAALYAATRRGKDEKKRGKNS
ncbi:MAG TPA: hypothetical protein PKO22_12210, partial [Treponemataceae bacterium]|nr:hypothetical protein [Treponemataceae bacterium]